MKRKDYDGLVLGITPGARMLGFVVFERAGLILEWGGKEVRESELSALLTRGREVMERFAPSVLVLEDVHHASSKRGKRMTNLVERLGTLAKGRGIAVERVPRAEMVTMFKRMGARNKDDIAAAVARLLPELGARLPPRRRIWDSEHYAMAMFTAAAFVLTHFARGRNGKNAGASP
ncbi:MAG: hypothetical protein ACRD9W_15040 [Terriglobia bacterium]